MLNILGFALNIIDEYALWLYVACLLAILVYIRSFAVARKDRENTIFTIEKEVAAHREGRAMTRIGTVLGVVMVVTALKYYVMPSIDLATLLAPTPTLTLSVPTVVPPTQTPTPVTPTATSRPRPTVRRVETVAPPTPTRVPAAACPDENVCITLPGMNASISGRVAIQGTANHDRFQFYKVEYGQGEKPTSWHVINDVHTSPVLNGLLEEFDTVSFPDGVYWLRLTVVDETGNFPPPCRVRVLIQNQPET